LGIRLTGITQKYLFPYITIKKRQLLISKKENPMRNILYTIVMLSVPLWSVCGNITKEQASKVAHNFYFERATLLKTLQYTDINISKVRTFGNSNAAYYVCDVIPDGFVVVSASSKVIPVLAYSFDSKYAEESDLPEGFTAWMNYYKNQIDYAVSANIIPSPEISDEWNRLLTNDFSANSDFKLLQSVSPLLVSKWNQDSPYNSWCPADPAGPGGKCYAGCVATAMGQLLNYYRFPQQGQGSYSYIHPDYGTISADFGATTYLWEGMLSTISKPNDPVGELLFHQGVSVDMDYGPDGSGMWNHKAAYSLKTHFRYGPETQYYFRDSVSIDWDSLLVTNLDQRKPLYYAGWAGVQSPSGHAFVCDGYQPGNYYHFNWGWGGSQDGYFYTGNLTPGGNNFNFAQEIIPMFPDTLQNTYPSHCQGSKTITYLRGSVEDGSGWFNYQDNAACSWLISPQDPEYDSIKSVKITFLKFDTEAEGDTLFIYNGADESFPLIGAYSGNSIPGVIISDGNKVFIKFITNSSITKGGWQFDYESIFPVYCSGTTTLTNPTGSIEDGSGEKKYSNNSVCRWKILPVDGLPVTFVFSTFELIDTTDFVKIYDLQTQELLGNFTGSQLPPTVTANSGKMMILFMTNASGNSNGWSGDYFASAVGSENSQQRKIETHVYPNPSNGDITIENFSSSNKEQDITISIFSTVGQLVFTNNVKILPGSTKIKLNIETLPPSVYIMFLEYSKQKVIKKIIISE
jgi:hypothetical protein